MGTDEKGRLNLSRRDAMPKPEGYEERRPQQSRPRNNNNDKFRENPNRRPYNREERKPEAAAPAQPAEPAKAVEEPETEGKGLFGFFKKK